MADSAISHQATTTNATELLRTGCFGSFTSDTSNDVGSNSSGTKLWPLSCAKPERDDHVPGFDGGMEWGGGAADPDGIYYVNVNEMPWLLQMIETRHADGTELSAGERDYALYCGVCHGLDLKGNAALMFPPLLEIDKAQDQS